MTQLEALQAALAGEHAAMYGVGVAGGKLSGARFKAATDSYEQHRDHRDHLSALVVAAGETPVAAEPAYDLPQAVTNAATAAALVLLIERRSGGLPRRGVRWPGPVRVGSTPPMTTAVAVCTKAVRRPTPPSN